MEADLEVWEVWEVWEGSTIRDCEEVFECREGVCGGGGTIRPRPY